MSQHYWKYRSSPGDAKRIEQLMANRPVMGTPDDIPLVHNLIDEIERLRAVIQRARTDLGLTAYEGTPVSVWSAKNIEKYLGEALEDNGGLSS